MIPIKTTQQRTTSLFTSGFTLIELMVSISIFAVVMVMSMGAVFAIVDANRKSRSLKSAMNNLNLAIETISRNVKFGTNWKCDGASSDCANGSSITFNDRFTLNGVLQIVSYRFITVGGIGQIERNISGGPNDTGGNYELLTSPEINITDFKLSTSGIGSDDKQPFMILKINGVVGTKVSSQTSFDLQSAVSQRELEE